MNQARFAVHPRHERHRRVCIFPAVMDDQAAVDAVVLAKHLIERLNWKRFADRLHMVGPRQFAIVRRQLRRRRRVLGLRRAGVEHRNEMRLLHAQIDGVIRPPIQVHHHHAVRCGLVIELYLVVHIGIEFVQLAVAADDVVMRYGEGGQAVNAAGGDDEAAGHAGNGQDLFHHANFRKAPELPR